MASAVFKYIVFKNMELKGFFMRVGHGYDVHRLKKGRKCILCGVHIPCDFGPDGHSDADVAVHALIDAILGALALGDIGKIFPDTDKMWKEANSIELLQIVYGMAREQGYIISNADITIVLESPRVAPYITQMREVISRALDTDAGNISVKATTEENLELIGDNGFIKSFAIILLNVC